MKAKDVKNMDDYYIYIKESGKRSGIILWCFNYLLVSIATFAGAFCFYLEDGNPYIFLVILIPIAILALIQAIFGTGMPHYLEP